MAACWFNRMYNVMPVTLINIFESIGNIFCGCSVPDDIPKNTTEPVWILGKQYSATRELDLIRRVIETRLWCTYRRGYEPIATSNLTTDKGWGCMLRSGQMLLAEALTNVNLGRNWCWTSGTRDPNYLKIVNDFGDTFDSLFAIHHIAIMGETEKKKIGEWFGPNTIGFKVSLQNTHDAKENPTVFAFRKLINDDELCSIKVYVALDTTIVINEVEQLCDPWKPLLLIIPLRLGISAINPIYIPGLKKCLEIPCSVGMVGGQPNKAFYFIGHIGDEALYLDPHTTQRCGEIGEKLTKSEIEMDATYHRKYANRIHFKKMDSSLALSFLCHTRAEFDNLCTRLKEDIKDAGIQPLFEVIEKAYEFNVSDEISFGFYNDFDIKA